jgi:hypothetical protein
MRSGEASTDRDGKCAKTGTSAEKIAANRLNAKKCTGPRTPRGKSHASVNALKHGIFARRRLIAGEDVKAYRELSQRVFAETTPRSAVETMLADQIVADLWRLRRVEQAERAYLDQVRASALSRVLRTLSGAEAQLVPDILGGTKRSAAGGEETKAVSVRQKLRSATHPDNVMLDAMIPADRAFPYSTLEQIRRTLLRDVMRKDSALVELQVQRMTIGIRQDESI